MTPDKGFLSRECSHGLHVPPDKYPERVGRGSCLPTCRLANISTVPTEIVVGTGPLSSWSERWIGRFVQSEERMIRSY